MAGIDVASGKGKRRFDSEVNMVPMIDLLMVTISLLLIAGTHRDAAGRKFDHAVVHAANETSYAELIAVMDAVSTPKRRYVAGGKVLETSAFFVSLAAD